MGNSTNRPGFSASSGSGSSAPDTSSRRISDISKPCAAAQAEPTMAPAKDDAPSLLLAPTLLHDDVA
ncbi:unnamed protein product [Phaeothamnion confervicola]